MFKNKLNSHIFIRWIITITLFVASVAFPTLVHADSTITVATSADEQNSNGLCSLREAIINANNNAQTYTDCVMGSGNDVILFNTALGVTTIVLSSTLPIIADSNGLSIYGYGIGDITISGNNSVGIFYISFTGHLTLDGITITDANNSVGGGVYNEGTLIITDSTFSDNQSTVGGGLLNNLGGVVTITHSTFINNTVTNDGGGVANYGTATIVNTTFSNNAALYGGGLNNNSGNATILNSTFSGNSAVNNGGGIFTWDGSSTPPTTAIRNTILANNGEDCYNYPTGILIGGNNIIEMTSTCTSLATITADPNLGSLTGSPSYFPPNGGSPAIHAGDDAVCAASPVSNRSQNGVARPHGAHCDIGSVEKLTTPTFADVPLDAFAWSQIESIYAADITGGCSTSPLLYCPSSSLTRAQMAIFLLKSIHGAGFIPPAAGSATGFSDVPNGYWAADWIKQLALEGITSGCGGGNYCPEATVSRAQMAVFLLKAKNGSSYSPPAVIGGTGFSDVDSSYWAAAFIKQLVADGITSGCGGGNYCPENPVTRAQMAIFLQKTFFLPLP